jgi:hypothetical protein
MCEIIPAFARRGGCADKVPLDPAQTGRFLNSIKNFWGNRPVRSFKGCFAAFLSCRGHPALKRRGRSLRVSLLLEQVLTHSLSLLICSRLSSPTLTAHALTFPFLLPQITP